MRSIVLRLLAVLALTAAIIPATALHAKEMPAIVLGGSELALIGPENHDWLNKDSQLGLKLAPSRYKNVLKHFISLYAAPGGKNIFKPYNNHGGIFYVGPKSKLWTVEEFAAVKNTLLGPGAGAGEGDQAARAYLQEFLREGVGFDLPNRKTKKYLERIRKAKVLEDGPGSLILAYRHKEDGQKDRYVVLSLTLLRGKLLGTAYYQFAPGKKERKRADELTLAWQQALTQAHI